IEKTALGATASVEWQYHEHTAALLKQLKEDGWTIVIIEQTDASIHLQDFKPTKSDKICLVFGNEIHGVREKALPFADVAVEIPQSGVKHSLNISVCVG